MAAAIEAVTHPHQQRNPCHQEGIEHQAVAQAILHQQCDAKLQPGLKQADESEGGHLLAGNDSSVVRDRKQLNHKRKQRTLKHNSRSPHTSVRDIHPIVEEPQSHSLGENHQHQGKDQLHGYTGREDLAQTGGVPTLPELEGKEAADGGRNAGGQEGEHRNHTADGVVHPVIRLPQRSQHHAGGEEPYEKEQQHTHIQEQSIAGNPPVVFRQAPVACVCVPFRIQNILFFEKSEHGRAGTGHGSIYRAALIEFPLRGGNFRMSREH